MKYLIVALLFIGSSGFTKEVVSLRGDNTVVFSQEIDEASVDIAIAGLIGKRLLLPPQKTLYLVLISPGGKTDSAYLLRYFIEKIPNLKIICKYCASAAGMIFVSSSHPRLISDKSELIMHEMYLEHVTAQQVKLNLIQSITKSSDEFNKIIYSRLRMSKSEYESKIINKTWVVSGKDILSINGADAEVEITCDSYMSKIAPKTCNIE